ncbi:unnamed protein product [Effrenium voratum]|uniref:Uncharacterized protein n=1 Tax=Effrenium voratum TaxID=2562239 RepID=A0AA36NHH6_9DINO|nr:unnamed protein product [Effrenium voratum]CAJ1406909.1 unnamed protein product [Effrenium voratum]CAJ1431339.1 unnamed protein product [Effrenium voratum]
MLALNFSADTQLAQAVKHGTQRLPCSWSFQEALLFRTPAFPGPCCTDSKSNSSLRGKVSLGKVCDSGHCTELADGRILKTYCQRWTAQFACLSRHGCDLSI